jgi:FMN phosphatase YigB (HAD superfamily)
MLNQKITKLKGIENLIFDIGGVLLKVMSNNNGIKVVPIEENISLLYQYKKSYRLFCITDASVSQLKFEAENFAFFQVFEDVIIAEQVGLNKDDQEIYNFTCKKHNLLPEKTLFIDDRISNIAAASKIGVKTVKY